MRIRNALVLLLLTVGALFVHGYHPWVEDAEIYLPAAEKIINPALFPFNTQFFESHAHLTFFPELIAASVRWSHLPLAWVLFFWQMASMFLLLWAGWELSGQCFTSLRARWASVTLLASVFTIPVAGTALYIMDQYVNPRNLTAFAGVLAISSVLEKKFVRVLLFLVFAAALHPLMAVFASSFCACLVLLPYLDRGRALTASLIPLGLFSPVTAAYHQVALSHGYFYLTRWHWYEWLGALAPLLIFFWYSRVARSRGLYNLELLCRAAVVYELVYIPVALIVSVSGRFETLARLQPMRSLHLVYILFFLVIGGLLGEFVLKNRIWRWVTLFLPLCGGMFLAQRALFPASSHVEWPWAASRNPWVQAFEWVRNNTPADAMFALNPYHMHIPGEDENGFRAVAERSMLADAVKDAGAVTMFPPNAEEWLRQVEAQKNWQNFQAQDFRRLQSQYGVNWVVLQVPGGEGLDCPYRNAAAMVCRIE